MRVHEHAASLGKVLSCFVTERKHRTVKACGTWAFGKCEHIVLRSMLYKQVVSLGDEGVFANESSVRPKEVDVDGISVQRAVAVRLRCGEVRKGDTVSLADGTVHKVDFFSSISNNGTICGHTLKLVARDRRDEWDTTGAVPTVSIAADIVHVHVFANLGSGIVRILCT